MKQNRPAPAQPIRAVVKAQATDEQLRQLGALVYGVLKSGDGLYLAVNQTTRSIKVRVYDGDDRYEDLIAITDNFPAVIGEILAELYNADMAAEALNGHEPTRKSR